MTFSIQERIINRLLLKAIPLLDIGLLHGKMGVSILFYNNSRYMANPLYGKFADELLDQIMQKMHKGLSIDFEYGLAGIAWGFEYLIHNNFVIGESNDICEEIDKKIMQIDLRRIDDLSLETGLEGLLHYILIHMQRSIVKKTDLPFDSTYLKDLYNVACSISPTKINDNMNILIKSYKNFYEGKEPIHYSANLSGFIENLEVNDTNLLKLPLGLRNGLAGFLLKNIETPEL